MGVTLITHRGPKRAHEFLLATADSNGDGIPDGWAQRFGFNAIDPGLAAGFYKIGVGVP